jgi:hypothetical protein
MTPRMELPSVRWPHDNMAASGERCADLLGSKASLRVTLGLPSALDRVRSQGEQQVYVLPNIEPELWVRSVP